MEQCLPRSQGCAEAAMSSEDLALPIALRAFSLPVSFMKAMAVFPLVGYQGLAQCLVQTREMPVQQVYNYSLRILGFCIWGFNKPQISSIWKENGGVHLSRQFFLAILTMHCTQLSTRQFHGIRFVSALEMI